METCGIFGLLSFVLSNLVETSTWLGIAGLGGSAGVLHGRFGLHGSRSVFWREMYFLWINRTE